MVDIKRSILALSTLLCLTTTAPATLLVDGVPASDSGACPTAVPSAEASIFLARTSGLDTTHICAYTNLINGLVIDSIWTKFDVLHVYATQDTTTAQLNLVSTSYPATLHGAPTFTADRGYTGVDSSSTVYIDTSFNGTTAPSPNFIRNSGHLSAWNVSNTVSSGGPAIGTATAGSGAANANYPVNSTGDAVLRVNGPGQVDSIVIANNDGFIVANRSGANDRQGYRNGAIIQNITSGPTSGSIAVQNFVIYALGGNVDGVAVGTPEQLSEVSIGSSLSAVDNANFYSRMCTYILAVGGSCGCAESTAFLARTSGIDVTHASAYRNLICGLVAAGVWPQLDALYIYATQDSTTALLNLVSATYNSTSHGSPTFTVDRGFTGGVSGGNTVYIDTNHISYTGGFQQNSAHLSVWSLANSTPDAPIGNMDGATVFWQNILQPQDGTGKFQAKITGASPFVGGSIAVADGLGHSMGVRTSSSNIDLYKNGVNVGVAASTSQGIFGSPNNIFTLAYARAASAFGGPFQLSEASIGATLTPTQSLAFYNQLRAYMTVVGVP